MEVAEEPTLFPDAERYNVRRSEWRGMPEFVQDDLAPWRQVIVSFANRTDFEAFQELVGQKVWEQNSGRTPTIWYPEAEVGRFADKRYAGGLLPKWPIYVVSKGRWKVRKTSDHLDRLGVRHFVVVEEAERERYEANVGKLATVLVLDPEYQRTYETCDELGDSKSKGPGPARNFAWDHSEAADAAWHWVMDDNIDGFFRLNYNLKTPASGAVFRAMEEFSDRYENVGMAGPNYFMFASRKAKCAPFALNTRIYSCNLIRNDAPYRWRGRYNEDTDLSIRMLRDGWVTVQFNAFLQFKATTQTMKGGNTAEFYEREGTTPKSEMLAEMHPDLARVVERWGRVHHYVDYSVFESNRLRLRDDVAVRDGEDDFGMTFQELMNGAWIDRERSGAWTAP